MPALALLISACGGGSEGGSEPPDTNGSSAATQTSGVSDSDLRQAVTAYSDAFLGGDPGAYDLLSARCQERIPRDEFEAVVSTAGEQYGSPLEFVTYSEDIADDNARVTYTYSVAQINQADEPWVREGGEWRQDDC